MTKKIIIIVGTALGVLALVAGLWWWFLNRPTETPIQTGTFGSGQTKTQTGAAPGTSPLTNIGTPLNSAAGTGSTVNSGAGPVLGGIGTGGNVVSATGQSSVPGVVWVSSPVVASEPTYVYAYGVAPGQDGTGSTANTSGAAFNPATINGVRGSNPTGGVIPSFSGGFSGGSNGGFGLSGALIGAGVAGAISCSAFLGTAIAGALNSTVLFAVQVNNGAKNAEDFLDCIARTIAKITLQEITASTVDWINSGFKGSPAFVQNQTQFFKNVADQAAGQFIQGSALSFLCSPFQLQIKIAIAQAYARRHAPSCTLTDVIGNINNFMNNTFSAGGWRGMLSYTTVPTNNPYGAFLYASIQLNARVGAATQAKQDDLVHGRGFLSFKKEENCEIYDDGTEPAEDDNTSHEPLGNGTIRVCDLVVTTPGSVIAASIDKTVGVSQDSLNLADSFDEIINALISQLMTNVLYGGLSSLSGPSGNYGSYYYTADQQQAISRSRDLLTQMQADTGVAQQYGAVQQGSIADIQSAQSALQGLINCWNNAAEAAAGNGSREQTAKTNADNAQDQMNSLNTQVTVYNNNITKANVTISLLESLQSRVLSAGSTAALDSIISEYTAAKSRGDIFTQADITTAQQNRQTLQGQMAAQNQQTANGLQQCNAF